MPSLENRVIALEQRITHEATKPYLFLIADNIEQAQADWVQSNKQPFPTDRPVALFSVIKPVSGDITK